MSHDKNHCSASVLPKKNIQMDKKILKTSAKKFIRKMRTFGSKTIFASVYSTRISDT